MSGGGNLRREGKENSSSLLEPATLFVPVNYSDFMVGNVGDSSGFIDLHLNAPTTIFPSLETRHKRNAAKRRKREKITPIHHLTTSIEVIARALMAEGKLIPRVRDKSSKVAVVEEEEDSNDDEDADEDDEDEEEDDYVSQPPYLHSGELSSRQADQQFPPLVQSPRAFASTQPGGSKPSPQPRRSAVQPAPVAKPVMQEIRPVGRPRTAHLKPPAEKRPRGRPRKNAEHYGVTPYTTATVPSNNGVYAAFMGSMAALPPPPRAAAVAPSLGAVPVSAVVKVETSTSSTSVSVDNSLAEAPSRFSS